MTRSIALVASLLGLSPGLSATSFPEVSEDGTGDYYVFLQKFPLTSLIEVFYHTEVLVCPKVNFSSIDRAMLDNTISGMTNFAQVPEDWWTQQTTVCVELGYGGSDGTAECSGVPHATMALGERQAVISNADVSKKTLYVYGTGTWDGAAAYNDVCLQKCWSNWAGTDYNALTNNCNTFTSTVLSCVYGLSEQKPNLGPSDMVTVSCNCTGASHLI
eukprot:CAMPEP_0194499576 /NCGR_PEP_ID=MMETSP0253-20130528/15843_1 /TAXON_ID=2966 /ORGANISM="Noctiluca scintillans" /LENGTH=215 /DNA_ID=CAMNT_0039341341 /DNA_START=29 /DNA_END=676 /DNA_ORIENTATION=-